MKLLFASTKVPQPGFRKQIADWLAELGCSLVRAELADGTGCVNIALDVDGQDEIVDKFGKQLCMALMPARWCERSDEITSDNLP